MSEEAEEILNQVIAGTSMHFNGAERDYIYRAMEKYKNLSSPQEVTDGEIRELAQVRTDNRGEQESFIHGAKWMRSKLNK